LSQLATFEVRERRDGEGKSSRRTHIVASLVRIFLLRETRHRDIAAKR